MKLFCQNCGQREKKYEINCSHCGTKLAVPYIPSNTGTAIAALIFLFLPTGLVSLIYSLKVNNKIKEGDLESAIKYSKKAILWAWISLFAVIIILALKILGGTL